MHPMILEELRRKKVGTTDPYTSLLIHSDTFDGDATFTDSSQYGHVITSVGTARHRTTAAMFGASSMYFDGAGDCLQVQYSDALRYGSNDFTIEVYVKRERFGSIVEWVIGQGQTLGRDGTRPAGILFASDKVYFQFEHSLALVNIISTSSILDTNWHYIKVTREANIFRLYVDNIEEASLTTDVTLVTSPYPHGIGCIGTQINTYNFKGFVDEIKISMGIAR